MSLDVYLYVEVDDGREKDDHVFFSSNITHNLGAMAEEAGVYRYVWRPEECKDISFAEDLVAPLTVAIVAMEQDPDRFRKHDADNGWGTYEQFLPWLREYRDACVRHPKALVRTSR